MLGLLQSSHHRRDISSSDNKGSYDLTTVTESLVDAKDDAVRGEVQTQIANAVADLRRDMLRMTQWIAGIGLATLGAVVAMGTTILARLP